MHSDIKITDGVYSILSNQDVQKSIGNLNKTNNSNTKEELINLLLQELQG